MTKQHTSASSGPAPQGVGAPDEMITIRRSDLAAAMVAELLEFFDDPRAGGSTLHEAEACWLVSGGIRRALREEISPKR